MTTRQRGFSLIELMVVIAIIAIIGAIAVPRLIGLQKGAQMSGAVANLRGTIAPAEETHKKDTFKYGSLAQLVTRNLVDKEWQPTGTPGKVSRGGYDYTEEVDADGATYCIKAIPSNADAEMKAYMILDGVVYEAPGDKHDSVKNYQLDSAIPAEVKVVGGAQ